MFQKDNERKREMKKWKFLTAAIGITMAVLVFAVFQGGAEVKAVIPGGILPDGVYVIQSVNSGKVMDSTLSTVPVTQIHQWGYHGDNQQKWEIEHLGSNVYKLKSMFNNKVLDVAYNSMEDFGAIITSDWHGGNNQRFIIEAKGYNSYAIKSLSSNKYLDVVGFSRLNGGKIIQYTGNNQDNQIWIFLKQN